MRYEHMIYNYVPLTEDELEFLKKQFKKYCTGMTKDLLDNVEQFKQGDLTKEEAALKNFDIAEGRYDLAMQAFMDKFGFRPIKVAYLEDKAPWEEK